MIGFILFYVVGSILVMAGLFVMFGQIEYNIKLRNLIRLPRFRVGMICCLLGFLFLVLTILPFHTL